MKNLLLKTAIAASLVLALAAPAQVNAQDNELVYDRKVNTSIGITADNAAGCSYEIRDKKGNVVLSGKIRSSRTFYIPTGKLSKGSYQFIINGNTLQQFTIR